MEKKVNIRLPKGKEAKNVQFNVVDGKIEVSYDVEDIFNPKDGDFLATEDGRVFIYNGLNTDVQYGAYCGIDIYNSIKFSYLSPAWTCKKGCRYATEDEKFDFLVRLEDECGKTWDFKEKKLVDVIRPKPGDFVISCNNTMFIFLSKEKGLYCGIYDMKNQFGQHSKYSTCIKVASMAEFRYATEEEKKEYLDFIKQKFNQVWNPEKLCFEDAYVPKFGDIVCIEHPDVEDYSRQYVISIFPNKEIPNKSKSGFFDIACIDMEGRLRLNTEAYYNHGYVREATIAEKQELFNKLAEAGKRWNPEKKQIEDIRWRAKEGENYWYIHETAVLKETERETNINNDLRYMRNNYFRTPEAAQKVADQIKEIFKNSKAE